MSTEVKWGILGAGRVAAKFAADLSRCPGARAWAVGSHSMERARAFAQPLGIPNVHDSYEALAGNPEVDVIYIATRNPFHAPCVRLCLEAGKPVVCEKPFAMNATEARDLIALARTRGLFLMEGMWTRCFPVMRELRRLIAEGELGELRMIQADFGYPGTFHPTHRLFDLKQGGGALFDVGIYPISFACMLAGIPDRVDVQAVLGSTGVDEYLTALLHFPNDVLASCVSSIRIHTFKEACVLGTKGRVKIHEPFWKPHTMSVIREGREPEVFHRPYEGFGFQFEAEHVMECLRAGRLESDLMPLAETEAIMGVLDRCRSGWYCSRERSEAEILK